MAFVQTGIALTAEQKQRIIQELEKRGAARSPCVRCGNPTFNILDFIFANIVMSGGAVQLGGPTVPTIAVHCVRCGAIHHHVLGLLLPLTEFGFAKSE